MILRHLLAILILPFTVVAIIPYWLLSTFAAQEPRWSNNPLEWPAHILGLLIFAAGFALLLWCVILFARVGRGTLAPWDPTQSLVAAGPYRYVRNPMISGVITMLIGESLFFGSWILAAWALFVFALNHAYFILSEEPDLEDRFGPAYVTYKSRVPRWFPRLKAD
jgi:protein-S-isoprenylcysteine O-methyltransferase Ste14